MKRKTPFLLKFLTGFFLAASIYTWVLWQADPYVLIGDDYAGKNLPYHPLYHYNFCKKFNSLDYAFLGSSSANYYPIEKMYPEADKLFSMGIESSTMEEITTYGNLLMKKLPKEIIFFVQLYWTNPSRRNQDYFVKSIISHDNKFIDFVYQYFNKDALEKALIILTTGTEEDWVQQFNLNGTRTQNHYKLDTSYNFQVTLANYLTTLYHDPHYYGSQAFRNPESILPTMKMLDEFINKLEYNNIKVRLVIPPIHRNAMALIYYAGLGATYERFREKLVEISPVIDMNLDFDYTCDQDNFWDSHHTRKSERIIEILENNLYVITDENLRSSAGLNRPTKDEIEETRKILEENPNRKKILASINSYLEKHPPKE